MLKNKIDFSHLFITQALTDHNTNLSIYKDEAFNNSLRLVAIDSIISILNKIHSKKQYALHNGESFSIMGSINQPHAITGLNMLDYCLAAGFNDMALVLLCHGATSKNLQAFRSNISNSFPSGSNHPEIVNDIYEIINGCLEIKNNYQQFVNKTNVVVPKMVSAGKRIYTKSSTPVLILFGLSGVILAPFLYPLVHGTAATALLISAGVLPAVISGVYSTTSGRQEVNSQVTDVMTQDDSDNDAEFIMLKELIKMAKDIRYKLHNIDASDHSKNLKNTVKNKKHVLPHSQPHTQTHQHVQTPLLFQLHSAEKHRKIHHYHKEVNESLKNTMS